MGESEGGNTTDSANTIDATGEGETKRREGGREYPSTPHTNTSGTVWRGADNLTTATMEGEGIEGDEPGYNANPEDLRLWEVYGDWVHANPGTHLYGMTTRSRHHACQAALFLMPPLRWVPGLA